MKCTWSDPNYHLIVQENGRLLGILNKRYLASCNMLKYNELAGFGLNNAFKLIFA